LFSYIIHIWFNMCLMRDHVLSIGYFIGGGKLESSSIKYFLIRWGWLRYDYRENSQERICSSLTPRCNVGEVIRCGISHLMHFHENIIKTSIILIYIKFITTSKIFLHVFSDHNLCNIFFKFIIEPLFTPKFGKQALVWGF
jgi:hypothetical protein